MIGGRTTMILALAMGLLLSLAPASPAAAAARYEVVGAGSSRVVFESKAPLETFEGKTDQVSGWFTADLDDLAAGVAWAVAVDLASFDTGKKKRNQHMRENHLETDRYPQAWFRGGRLLGAPPATVAPGREVTLAVQGELDLHGVKRPVTCDVTLRRDGDQVRVSAAFPVKLSDHAIDRPKFLVMKLADEQMVRVSLVAERRP